MAVELQIETSKAEQGLKMVETAASNLEALLGRFQGEGATKVLEALEQATGIPVSAVDSVAKLQQAAGQLAGMASGVASFSNQLSQITVGGIGQAASSVSALSNNLSRLSGAASSGVTPVVSSLNNARTAANNTKQAVADLEASLRRANSGGNFSNVVSNLQNVGTAARSAVQGVDRITGAMSFARGAMAGAIPSNFWEMFQRVRGVYNDAAGAAQSFNSVVGQFRTPPELTQIRNNLAGLAVDTGQGYASVQNMYTQFASAMNAAGADAQQTDNLFRQAQVGLRGMGLSAQNVEKVMGQLSQGLRGSSVSIDSISESMGVRGPDAVNKMASALGMGTDAFTKLAQEGKLSGDQVAQIITMLGQKFGGELPNQVGILGQSWAALTGAVSVFYNQVVEGSEKVPTAMDQVKTATDGAASSSGSLADAAARASAAFNPFAGLANAAANGATHLAVDAQQASKFVSEQGTALAAAVSQLAGFGQSSGQAAGETKKLGTDTSTTNTSLDGQVASAGSAKAAIDALTESLKQAAAAQRELNQAQSGGGGGGGSSTEAPSFSGGGIVGQHQKTETVPTSAFVNAPSFAGGGVSSGGIPAILHKNEAVVPLTGGGAIPIEGVGGSAPKPMSSSGSGASVVPTLLEEISLRADLHNQKLDELMEVGRNTTSIMVDQYDLLNGNVIGVKNQIVEQTAALNKALQDAAKTIADSRTSRPTDGGGGGDFDQFFGRRRKGFTTSGGGGGKSIYKPSLLGGGEGVEYDPNELMINGIPVNSIIKKQGGRPRGGIRGFARGSPNAYDDAVRGGAFSATLHPDEAVVPLPDGRSVPIELGDRLVSRVVDEATKRSTGTPTSPRASDGTNIYITMNINAADADSFRRSADQILQELQAKLEKVARNIGTTTLVEDPTRRRG